MPELRHQRLELVTTTSESFEEHEDMVALFRRTGMHKSAQETFWALAYGPLLNVAAVFEVNRGNFMSVSLHVPSLLGGVLAAGVERFILAHNHTTASLVPSPQDIELTKTVMEAANACRLMFEDHLILTSNGQSYSFAAAGILVPAKNTIYDIAAGKR